MTSLQCLLCVYFTRVKTPAHIYMTPHFFLARESNICLLDNGNPLQNVKTGLTPTTHVTPTAISPIKMSIGRKSPIDLRSEMIFLQEKSVFYTFLPSTPPY